MLREADPDACRMMRGVMHADILRTAHEFPPAQLHAAFGEAFADYLTGPFNLPLDGWPVFLGRQGVDLARSRVALRGDTIAAFAFVAVREDAKGWRLATMGVVPCARGSGAAQVLLDDFLARAQAEGCEFAELECFAQNERALRLYRGRGFEVSHELLGYTRPPDAPARHSREGGNPKLPLPGFAGMTVPLPDAFAWLDAVARRRGDLPLQVTSPSLRAQPLEWQALRHGAAQAIYAATAPGKITVSSLVDDGSPQQRDAESVISALVTSHPGATITVPQLQRRDLGGAALEGLGFERLPLHQVMMRRAFGR